MIDLQELRRLAEKAIATEQAYNLVVRNPKSALYPGYAEADAAEEAINKLVEFAYPDTIIELLDRIDRAEKVCGAASEMVRCQGSRYIDFHINYGNALKATRTALAEWRGE